MGLPSGLHVIAEKARDLIHPDDRESAEQAWNSARADGKFEIECRVLAGGQIRWIRCEAGIEFDAEGRRVAAVGTVQDITERRKAEEALRRSEQRYQLLFEKNVAGVSISSMEGEILDCNDAGARILRI
jgi:PAS domain-containing protein